MNALTARRLDYFLTENPNEGDEIAFEAAMELLGSEVRACGDKPEALASLLAEVIGNAKAAEVIRDYLRGDSDTLNAAVVGWAK